MITSLSQLDLDKSYTYADYLLWQFEERVEIIKGKIMQMAAPSREHQQVIINLILVLGDTMKHGPCKIYPAPFDVRLTRFSPAKNVNGSTT